MKEEFCIRMKSLLGDEYDSFMSALEKSAVRAIRINSLKVSEEEFLSRCSLTLKKIPFAKSGYIVSEGGEGLGNSPEHHSGEIYIQDPGAMSAFSALPSMEGKIYAADLCAAPGGKSGQLATLTENGGLLLSNEYVKKRAMTLVGNMERLGVKNAVVVSYDTDVLSSLLEEFFDVVLTDVPCSGEGMFRKGEVAREEWSPENVLLSKKRAEQILKNAARMLKPGGYLLFSTCTYSLEENEMQIDEFLDTHPDFSLEEIENEALAHATADGIVFPGAKHENLTRCRRFYPHIAEGEGQFIALLKKNGNTTESVQKKKKQKERQRKPLITKEDESIVHGFFKSVLGYIPEGRLRRINDKIELLPEAMPTEGLYTVMAGVSIGQLRGRLLIPHHHFFMAFGKDFLNKQELKDAASAERYLSGEELPCDVTLSGYAAITYHGVPLGGAKASSGVMKNHYPKGLRLPPR